ncbi:MAG: hypothetical protein PHY74_02145, partial [Candidatus Bathyarchaeota archaeon]|nr:hypothetical protein [Candidatus Bathyarchaeota archaeon]
GCFLFSMSIFRLLGDCGLKHKYKQFPVFCSSIFPQVPFSLYYGKRAFVFCSIGLRGTIDGWLIFSNSISL